MNTIINYTKPTVKKYLVANGYTYLGSGVYQQAFKENSTGFCYKIGRESSGLERYIQVAQEIESEYLAPVFEHDSFEVEQKRHKHTHTTKWIQYRTELLEGVKVRSKLYKDFKNAVDTADSIRSHLLIQGRPNKKKIINRIIDWYDADTNPLFEIETFYDFIKTMIKKRKRNHLDVHEGNFMIRTQGNKSTIVMVDPYC